ncbi:MAG: septum formation protein Maf [Pirellulales bacterium]|nr:septum formation protein Maf [Pirellulales bacterium]
MHLILASASPRRRELMRSAGYSFDVVPPESDAEDAIDSKCSPAELVKKLAIAKAANVAHRLAKEGTGPRNHSGQQQEPTIVLAADTVAECDGHVLGKPDDEQDARRMLQMLSGRTHRVLSGVCIWPIRNRSLEPYRARIAVTVLRMDRLTQDQVNDYLASGQWCGKAGAFGYQDRLGWVHVIDGSESNVVGLPMELVQEMLGEIRG